jgi:N-acetylglucosamine-6-phosphate deacetylase
MRITGRSLTEGLPIEVTVENGVIRDVAAATHSDDAWVGPGLIDLQVNGYGGEDMNVDGLVPETVVALTEKLLRCGTTTFLPTVITSSEAKICHALETIAAARRASKMVEDAVPGVHVEGPHISSVDGFHGAHDLAHVRAPEIAELERWQKASGGLVTMVTVSPHWERVEEYIAFAAGQGITVALGHTHGSAEQIRRAVDAGARLSTHLGNGIAGSIDRHANAIWPQLADDRLSCAMIADGHHLPADMLKTFVRAKGLERSILVSDSVSLGGMPPGDYTTPVGGRVRLREDGRLGLADSGYLAGATIPLKNCVAFMHAAAAVSLHDAVQMASSNPGRFVGGRGVLEPGARAALVRFTLGEDARTLQIHTVIAGGREIVLNS